MKAIGGVAIPARDRRANRTSDNIHYVYFYSILKRSPGANFVLDRGFGKKDFNY